MVERKRIRCPLCRRRLLAREEAVGERRTCPSCRIEIIVPAPAEEPAGEISMNVVVGAALGFFATPMLVCMGAPILFPSPSWGVAQGLGMLLPCPTLLAAPVGGLLGGLIGARLSASWGSKRGNPDNGRSRRVAGPPEAASPGHDGDPFAYKRRPYGARRLDVLWLAAVCLSLVPPVLLAVAQHFPKDRMILTDVASAVLWTVLGYVAPLAAAVVLGMVAFVLGKIDVSAMENGSMDPSGLKATRTASQLGFGATLLACAVALALLVGGCGLFGPY